MASANPGRAIYQRLRVLPWARLWAEEVPRFNQASSRERFEGVPVIRAVGVVFAESGPAMQKEEVKAWLISLLQDPEEKIRRYAMAALPKIGVGPEAEAELLTLLQTTPSLREQKFLGQTLDKIGGAATLEALGAMEGILPHTAQRVNASIARGRGRGEIRMDVPISGLGRTRIHLRGRRGLEGILRQEVEGQGQFRVVDVKPGLVAVTSPAPFTLGDLYAMRCFGSVGFVLGLVKPSSPDDALDAVATTLASPMAVRLFESLTLGPPRYRLGFIGKGHQRGAVRRVADRAYSLCPGILNDAREAPWSIDVHPTRWGDSVELRPRLSPDPRHAYRLDDVPAASHPPLAACLARLAGPMDDECVWDPFCGSGLELVERALLGCVRTVHGCDVSAEAVAIAERNFSNAPVGSVEARFTCCDFREYPDIAELRPGSLTLLISNPPLGRRVRIPNLRGLFDDLFAVAAEYLAPGGRLVFTNPFRMESPQPTLQLTSRQVVDLGGYNCRVESYAKQAR